MLALLIALVFPISASGRTLVDATGAPVRLQGDAGWSMISNLTAAEQITYLDGRTARGFNAVLLELFEHKFAANAPANRAGDFPFTAHTAGSYDFTTPNEAYWTFVDASLERARTRGVIVLASLMYAGFAAGNEGWWTELTNGTNTAAKCYAYGLWLGNRYKAQSNLIWVFGGDYTIPSDTSTESGESRMLAIYDGLKASGDTHLITAHLGPGTLSTDWTRLPQDLHSVYTGSTLSNAYTMAVTAYNRSAKPVLLFESNYEMETGSGDGTPATMREVAWWASAAGAVGHIYGHRDTWAFQTGTWCNGFAFGCVNWPSAMTSTGSGQMAYVPPAFAAYPALLPSGLGGQATLITAGGGTSGTADWVQAAATSTVLIAYVPPAHTGSITVDLSVLSGPARVRWYDPTDGSYRVVTHARNASGFAITPPAANSAGAADFVLVVDVQPTARPFRSRRP